jgi:hypothetical protein
VKWLSLLFIFFLFAAPARAQVHVGGNRQVLNCFQYGSGLQANQFCINQGLSSGWFPLQGDASMYTGPLCSDNNNSKCGFITINGLDGVPFSGTLANGQTWCYQSSPSAFIPCTTGGGASLPGTFFTSTDGAVGDDVHDDGPNIQTTINKACAAGGGTILLTGTTGNVFLVNSNNGAFGSPAGIQIACSHVHFNMNGSTIDGTQGNVHSTLFTVGSDTPGFEANSTLRNLNAASVGMNQVTMTTVGQAADFVGASPTNPIPAYLIGTTGNNDKDVNWVIGENSTTGVVTLRDTLVKNFLPTPQIANVASITYQDDQVTNGTVLAATSYVFYTAQIANFKFENLTTINSGSGREAWGGFFTWDGEFDNIHSTTVCNVALDLSTRGDANIKVNGGTYNTTGSCTTPVTVVGVGEGVRNVQFDGGTYTDNAADTGGLMYGISLGPSYNTSINDVTIYDGTTTNPVGNGAGVFTHNGGAANSAIIHNSHIFMEGGRGLELQGVNDLSMGNDIHLLDSGGSTIGIYMQQPASSIDDQIFENGQTNGIYLEAAAIPSQIEDDRFSCTSGCTTAILQTNPGSPVSGTDDLILGNNILTPAAYSNTAVLAYVGANEPNLILSNNSGTGNISPVISALTIVDAAISMNTELYFSNPSAPVSDLLMNSNPGSNAYGSWDLQGQMGVGPTFQFYFTPNGGAAVSRFYIDNSGNIGSSNGGTWFLRQTGDSGGANRFLFNTTTGLNIGPGGSTAPSVVINLNGTMSPGAFVFANIAATLTTNGQIGYCSDCTITNPCAGSGNGAIAKRLNGVNVCN